MSSTTIRVLLELISRFGLSEMLVSDKGPWFTSQGFAEFCAKIVLNQRQMGKQKEYFKF